MTDDQIYRAREAVLHFIATSRAVTAGSRDRLVIDAMVAILKGRQELTNSLRLLAESNLAEGEQLIDEALALLDLVLARAELLPGVGR